MTVTEKIRALCFVWLEQTKLQPFLDNLKNFHQVKRYYAVTGEIDGVIELEVEQMGDLFDVIKKLDLMEGLKTETHIVLRQFDMNIPKCIEENVSPKK
ncbi:MAG: hypothetical protein RBG13Loki_1040 [Promethearchaeota archaeon CR_4]|nr:MAG: hypothetical protein RBG13Loki_1040 [Candidatus Lokiarchaeota archaeon CR_4]